MSDSLMAHNDDSVLIQSTSPETALVFGLNWDTLVGANIERQSYKWASASKASHYVRAGRHSPATGYVHLKLRKNQRKQRLYSAAAIFAQSHSQGVFLERLDLPDGRQWVVAAQDGVVISGTDRICTPDEANALVETLVERYPQIVQITTEETEFSYFLNEKSLLLDVRSLVERTPMWMRYVAGLVLILMLADITWTQYTQYKARQERQQQAAQFIDVDALWIKTLDEWQNGISLHGLAGLRTIYDSLGALPLSIGSWTLAEAGCNSSVAGWQCNAHYRRVAGSNESFRQHAPRNWTVGWNGLGGAVGNWNIPFTRIVLDRLTLPRIEDVSLSYVSELQGVLPAFNTYTLDPPASVDIPNPVVTRADGLTQTYPHPGSGGDNLKIPKIQHFKLDAPLRSLSVLPLMDSTTIDSIRVVHKTGAAGQSLTKSIFAAQVTGAFYVQ
ncbi:type 4b pilus protein PilO2 [Stutzerimonas stutzeri]